MELTVIRKYKDENRTIGELHINGVFFCHTLEDTARNISKGNCIAKEYGRTAIPLGKYTVALTYSNRFKRYLPLLVSVPCFEGIRIHGGNTEHNTEGCILVGAQTDGKTKIWNCAGVLSKLIAAIKKVEKTEKISIEVK